jgi:glycosyltransferase involved in cell wall biosynthesis
MNNSEFNNHLPRVSIALPVYNGENYVRKALDSLLAQSYKDFELLIGDNASTDGTQAICESYAEQDGRIRYMRNETNIGAAANYNRLFELARGEYFKWAAHDDVCSPDFLKSCVEKLDSDPSVVLCCPKEIAIDKDGVIIENYMDKYPTLKHINSTSTYQRFYDFACLNHGCFQVFGLIRASALRLTPKIANYIGSDRVLLAELSLMGRFWESPEPIYLRRHSEQYCSLKDDSARTAWFNPKTGRKFGFTTSDNFLEYVKSIRRVKLSWLQRILCYLVMVNWIRKMRYRLFREFKAIISDTQARQDFSKKRGWGVSDFSSEK